MLMMIGLLENGSEKGSSDDATQNRDQHENECAIWTKISAMVFDAFENWNTDDGKKVESK